MKSEMIERIIKLLERVRLKPRMYLKDVTADNLAIFLAGFSLALDVVEPDIVEGVLSIDVARERGHVISCGGIKIGLRNEGLNEEQIVDEWLTIEIEAWRRLLGSIT
jgi:hypothetical protein